MPHEDQTLDWNRCWRTESVFLQQYYNSWVREQNCGEPGRDRTSIRLLEFLQQVSCVTKLNGGSEDIHDITTVQSEPGFCKQQQQLKHRRVNPDNRPIDY